MLSADELLTVVQAQAAVGKIAEQSKLTQAVWRRDLLAAIRNYAEFVQLMPASESHHHAHPGGLLVHTLEVLIAAMTWRNGHFLPEGDTIERIDSQRDQWTYVVFFAALLHDIAKPMTDLRIIWRAQQMPEALRWTPIAGSLVDVCRGHNQPEYRVAFTPKSQRDYTSHSRLALILLHQIAPASALHMLAGTPDAMDALATYLSAQDKSSLVARIVQHADRASTARALRQGVRTRFATATSVPLVELLMTAVRSMLRNGTELPLNRTGAAGWVYEGSVWFTAKRLADAARHWIQENAPDESVPGEQKNDRLFDTWQEYGCILPSPETGQAIWYVTIMGEKSGHGRDAGVQDSGYQHRLSVLRFPLEKLYESADMYPPAMNGRIELRGRPQLDAGKSQETGPTSQESASSPQDKADPAIDAEATSRNNGAKTNGNAGNLTESQDKIVRQPAFNKPKLIAATVRAAKAAKPDERKPRKDKVQGKSTSKSSEPVSEAEQPEAATVPGPQQATGSASKTKRPRLDQFDDRSVRNQVEHAGTPGVNQPDEAQGAGSKRQVGHQQETDAGSTSRDGGGPGELVEKGKGLSSINAPQKQPVQGPVRLEPNLPDIPGMVEPSRKDPDEIAIAFMNWIQQGLRDKTLTYNETGAIVHFTEEGMALVSPLVFKTYAAEVDPECDPNQEYKRYQRAFVRAGWHIAYKGKSRDYSNILTYDIHGRGGKRAGHLSAVVLRNPGHWVDPVPPANPVLKLNLAG